MEKNKKDSVDLTWIVYLAYAILLGISAGFLPEGMFTPAKWVLTAMLTFLNIFIILGVGMMFLALKKAKESRVTMTVNQKEQKKWSWVLVAEILVVYYLLNTPKGDQLTFIASLVATKVLFTVIFMILHMQLRKILPTEFKKD